MISFAPHGTQIFSDCSSSGWHRSLQLSLPHHYASLSLLLLALSRSLPLPRCLPVHLCHPFCCLSQFAPVPHTPLKLGLASEWAKRVGGSLGKVGSFSPVLLRHVIGQIRYGRGRKGKHNCWKQSLAKLKGNHLSNTTCLTPLV